MSDAKDSNHENVDVSVSRTAEEDVRARFSSQLYQDYTEAAKQIGLKEAEDDEKLDALLSNLHMDKENKDQAIQILRDTMKGDDAESALNRWKLMVVTLWGETANFQEMEDEEVQRVLGNQAE